MVVTPRCLPNFLFVKLPSGKLESTTPPPLSFDFSGDPSMSSPNVSLQIVLSGEPVLSATHRITTADVGAVVTLPTMLTLMADKILA